MKGELSASIPEPNAAEAQELVDLMKVEINASYDKLYENKFHFLFYVIILSEYHMNTFMMLRTNKPFH